jgi:glycosyltransferase involved in cell wall biosynthesis
MHIAMLSPIAWRTPPSHYGPWESVASLLTEGLVARGHDVTLFATADSLTSGTLHAVCPRGYEEDRSLIPKVWECLHISELFEDADGYDIIHNHFDFLPLSYTGLTTTPVLTTIHGFSSRGILPVYKKYNSKVFYVSISDADRSPDLDYIKTIHHGIDILQFDFQPAPDDYLLFFGRIHKDKGARQAIEIARACKKNLILAGIIQDQAYYDQYVAPHLDNDRVIYVGSGLSVIESMACGTPVIAFDRGSMPELIESGKNGFLVNNVDEAMETVARIKEIDRAYCRRQIERHFTVDRMISEYIQVYEMIL